MREDRFGQITDMFLGKKSEYTQQTLFYQSIVDVQTIVTYMRRQK